MDRVAKALQTWPNSEADQCTGARRMRVRNETGPYSAHPDGEGQQRAKYQGKAGPGKEGPFTALPSTAISFSRRCQATSQGKYMHLQGLPRQRALARGGGETQDPRGATSPPRSRWHGANRPPLPTREKSAQDTLYCKTGKPKRGNKVFQRSLPFNLQNSCQQYT